MNKDQCKKHLTELIHGWHHNGDLASCVDEDIKGDLESHLESLVNQIMEAIENE